MHEIVLWLTVAVFINTHTDPRTHQEYLDKPTAVIVYMSKTKDECADKAKEYSVRPHSRSGAVACVPVKMMAQDS